MEQPKIEQRFLPVAHARRVLIVVQDDALRDEIVTIIEAENLEALVAKDGQTALTCAVQDSPDLMIVQESLADVDGYVVCQYLQRLTDHQRIPAILITDDDNDETVSRAYEAGAVDVIARPIRAVVLANRVRVLLKMREMRVILIDREERYRMISTMISDYAYAYRVTDDGQLHKEWNTLAFETITGYEPHELTGDGWSSLIYPDDMPAAQARMERLLRGEKDVSEFRIVTKNGDIRWLLDHGLPVWDETQGRVVRIYGAAQDITARKNAEEMMRRHTDELRARNEELDAFAHTVAHDLKNPIASMMGFASLVLNYYDRMDAEPIKEYLQLIVDSGYKLKQIINSILLLAGVTRQEQVQLTTIDMGDVIYGAQSRLLPMIEETNAQIIMPPRFPNAMGYGPWVEEIWANYLSNALKYGGTPPRIEFGADELPEGQVRFWIQDNGAGIDAEAQNKIFLPFTRMNQAKIEGHGLGLSVVQRIVERLGGEVGVESEVGRGSRFYFTLPCVPQESTV